MGANHSPALPLLAWLLHVGGPCTVCLSSPSEKSLPGTSVPLRATVGRPHSPTLWQVHSLSGSWTVMASHGPPPLPAPGVTRIPQVLWDCPDWQPLPHPAYSMDCVLLAAFLSPQRLFMSRSLLAQAWDFPTLGGEGAARLLSLSQLSSSVPQAARSPAPSPGTFPMAYKTFLLTVYKCPLHTLASKLHSS